MAHARGDTEETNPYLAQEGATGGVVSATAGVGNSAGGSAGAAGGSTTPEAPNSRVRKIYDSGLPWLRTRPGQAISEVAYSPLGTYLVAGNNDEVTIWHAPTSKLRHLFAIPHKGIFAFSPDERWLAFVGTKSPPPLEGPHKELGRLAVPAESQVCVVDLTNGEQEWFSANGLTSVAAVGFSADGVSVLAAGAFYSLVEWNLVTKDVKRKVLAAGFVGGAHFSPKGNVVVWWPKSKLRRPTPLHVITIESGKSLVTFSGHRRKAITDCAFTCNGQFFATSGQDRTVRLWNIERKREERQMALPPLEADTYPQCLSFNPQADRLVTGFRNGPYTTVDVETGTLQNILRVEGEARACASSPITSFVDLVWEDRTLRPFCPHTYAWKPRGSGHSGHIVGTSFMEGNRQFVTCDEVGRIFRWHIKNDGPFDFGSPKKLSSLFDAATKPIRTTAFSTDGRLVAIGRPWSRIELYDILSNKKLSTLSLRRWSPIGLAYSSQRKLFAVSCGRQQSLAERGLFITHRGMEKKSARFLSPQFLDDGETLLAIGKNELLDIDVSSAHVRRRLPLREKILRLATLNDGDLALCVTIDKVIVVDRRQWVIKDELSNFGTIQMAALAPLSTLMALSHHKDENYLSIIDTNGGALWGKTKRKADKATDMSFSSSGKLLLIGADTGSLELFELD